MTAGGRRTLVEGLGFAESPRWHRGELWFVDFFSGHVHVLERSGRLRVAATVPGMPGGLGFLPDGTPLVVAQRELAIYALGANGELQRHADLSRHARGAANDMLVDSRGRAYVGHHGFDFFGGAAPQPASLLLVEPDGMALTADARTLVVAESFAARLSAFDVAADGSLGARRDWAVLTGHTPDGICLDHTGAAWLGSPLTGEFLHVHEGGEVLGRLPAGEGRWAVACALGGNDGRTLYLLSAATTLEGMPQGKSTAFVESVAVNALPTERLA
jgi:sugar lactone lactonase YvrE